MQGCHSCFGITLAFDTEEELIAYAFKANTGGALPPTSGDIEHTVEQYLQRNVSTKRIAEYLGFPLTMVKKYVTEVKSRMERVKLQRARVAVAEGEMKVAEAAIQYDVDLDKLKELVSGERRGKKEKLNQLKETKNALSLGYKSNGVKNGNAIKKFLEAYREGDATSQDVEELFKWIKNHDFRLRQTMNDWERRFDAMKNGEKISLGK